MNIELGRAIIERVQEGRSSEWTVLGWCRKWTGLAMDEVEKWARDNGLEIKVEAREVRLPSGIEHTFVRFYLGDQIFVMDGVGVEKKEPFFGLLDDAPEHLKNGRLDLWIMSDRNINY